MNNAELQKIRERLLQIIREKSYEKKDVILASGRNSDFYIDCRQTTFNPEGAYLVGRIFYDMIKKTGIRIDAVGGPTMGADPIATAISIISYLENDPIPAFIIRKEPKKYGMDLWIEGKKNIRNGANAVIVEDVVTTGASSIKAAKRAEEEGLKVSSIFAMVDRNEGGKETIKEAGYRFESIFTKEDIIGG